MNRDMTFCTGDGCDKKETCARWLEHLPKEEHAYVYVMQSPYIQKLGGQSCCHYKPIK